jgi:hypothetical protein
MGFGGYSALLSTDNGTLTAISDSAMVMQLRRPDFPPAGRPRFGELVHGPKDKVERDTEAATRDPLTDTRWYAYERVNQIRRIRAGETAGVTVRPRAMRDWAENGGPEAMTRLGDGRFIVLAEDAPWLSQGGHAGLLFPADPVSGAEPVEFTFRPPVGYDPSDMAALPDGRVLILLRTLDLPRWPFFRGMLVLADPADIAPGRDWRWRKLADLDDPLPRENYEGLAIVPAADGMTLWLVSDDNQSVLQRTLLVKLHWRFTWPGEAGNTGVRRPRRPS